METALADLIDNSITATASKVELLLDTERSPFSLFIADDGYGMTESELSKNMRFPSSSPESSRKDFDLGRFGLGLKTASFSQTRQFTVISRKAGSKEFKGRTWDVDFLRQTRKWHMLKNTPQEIAVLLDQYQTLSTNFLNRFSSFTPNTIIIWQGLYKFEKYLSKDKQKESLKKELSENTSDYLSLVFHRFLDKENKNLSIRINNTQLTPFDPFPSKVSDIRKLPPKQTMFNGERIRLEGYVLPVRSLDESKNQNSEWSTPHFNLLDLEGIYIYRSDRIILFGGWNGIIRKSPNLQLARLKVDVGNKIDHLLHLNVAKSQIKIPYEVKSGFYRYMSELKAEAQREYFNRGIKKFPNKEAVQHVDLFVKSVTNKGVLLELNPGFPLIQDVIKHLSNTQKSSFKVLMRLINASLNRLRQVHYDDNFQENSDVQNGLSTADLVVTVQNMLHAGLPKQTIADNILPSLGYRQDTLPKEVLTLISS